MSRWSQTFFLANAIVANFVTRRTARTLADVLRHNLPSFAATVGGEDARRGAQRRSGASFSLEDAIVKKMKFLRAGASDRHLRDITGVLSSAV